MTSGKAAMTGKTSYDLRDTPRACPLPEKKGWGLPDSSLVCTKNLNSLCLALLDNGERTVADFVPGTTRLLCVPAERESAS
ncbi:hypothetical protein Y032_0036g3343 [Ancylostoma ceylanicum]|nr:hypothetical protein Y032_0036g3343 [Ancylostoma ceylanicum]